MQLQEYKLLQKHHSEGTYLTAEKGIEFLRRWTDLQEILGGTPKLILDSRHNKIQFVFDERVLDK
jgi:hypothetical protein